MRIDPASARALQAVIEADLATVRRIEGLMLATHPADAAPGVVAVGYYLHNLYSALENSFDQVSRTFENHVKDTSRWHQELLNKMFLDLSPLRPAVLPPAVRELMNDLRAFRHFFRHSYGVELNPQKLAGLRQRWTEKGEAVTEALDRFAEALSNASRS